MYSFYSSILHIECRRALYFEADASAFFSYAFFSRFLCVTNLLFVGAIELMLEAADPEATSASSIHFTLTSI